METSYPGVDRVITTGVLVVGAGAAAIRTAVAAADAGAQTTVVLKGQRGRSGATVSPDSPGVAWQVADVCSGDGDSPEVHFRNIYDVALGMADPRLARVLAYEIVEQTELLERWGLRFIPDPEGKKPHYSGYSCFGDQPRAHGIANTGFGHAGDVVRVLVDQFRAREVAVHENIFITDLLVQDGACAGALALGGAGEVIAYRAGAVVIASGGARQIFPQEPDRAPIDTTGDGYAMALRAGAELTNMEFIQHMLHPAPPFPIKVPGVYWALFPKLKNRFGEEALTRYLPPGTSPEQVMHERTLHYPFSCRDDSKWLDIAIANEIRAGNGAADGTLYMDFSGVDLSRFVPSRPQHMPEDFNQPVELPDAPVRIRPAAHAVNGGLRTDERAESTLPGLFAVGEAATGSHGADRLGGGMVSGSQVFGARAGRFAAEHAQNASLPPLKGEALDRPLARLKAFGRGERRADDALAELQEAAGAHLGVLRNAPGLETLIARVQELAQKWLPQVDVSEASALRRSLEVDNALLTAEAMARAAQMRQESRGSHYREDYPAQDDPLWRVNILLRLEDGKLRLETGSLDAGAQS